MLVLGPVGFTAPWLLLGLVALPILWLLLRAVPPAPIRRRFPGVALLLGLMDENTQSDRTPWWLLLLRSLAIAFLIIGFAGPVLNPQNEQADDGPLLILADGTWADARDWPRRIDQIEALLSSAARSGRLVALVRMTDLPVGELSFQIAESWQARLAGFNPLPWQASDADVAEWGEALEGSFQTYWLSDGLASVAKEKLLPLLEARGPVTVYESPRPVLALAPARFEEGALILTAHRAVSGQPLTLAVTGYGLDPAGTERPLVSAEIGFEADETTSQVSVLVQPELRNRITRFVVPSVRSAGAVTLADDALRRREVAMMAGRDDREGLELLSPLHYLNKAMQPTADIIDGDLLDVLLANPDVLIMADIATLAEAETRAVVDWVEEGGLLVRFAGPRLAASDVSRNEEDPLLPVRLRAGGRSVGGAMSWGEPKALRPFEERSPFFGLSLSEEVSVSSQVMAQPDPQLANRVIASLADGTPLVTRKPLGEGAVVLFHVTANAEWSTLPLSGLFVQMLERLAASTRPAFLSAEELDGTSWQPDLVLSAFGDLEDAGTLPGVSGERLGMRALGPDLQPGLYAGDIHRIALNVVGPDAELVPMAWPARIPVEGLDLRPELPLKGFALAMALLLFAVDVLASLWLSGRLIGPRAGVTALALLILIMPVPAPAQTDDTLAIQATSDVVLAHILTGDARVDETATAGLSGLSSMLFRRTSIEPSDPVVVNIETDELAFFPFLYWPISVDQPIPSDAAYAKLNRYLRSGGMILFDTRDSDTARFGTSSPAGRKLQQLARPLDIPPLEQIPSDHVLTRAFYLLQDFPGRHRGSDVWVEAAPARAEQAEGLPFRNLNDGVTPVVIGGNDWGSAWAIDARGAYLFPVGRGYAGERQREIAFRFGINLIMHVLTGNYKSDQVHVPALLDRLGQ